MVPRDPLRPSTTGQENNNPEERGDCSALELHSVLWEFERQNSQCGGLEKWFLEKTCSGKAGTAKGSSPVKKMIQTSPWLTPLILGDTVALWSVSTHSLQWGYLPDPPGILFVVGG